MTETKRGRPRNRAAQQAILLASYELLLQEGFKNVTVEKIAERAGVSKATIYKWWPNKAAVVMDGFLNAAAQRMPVPDTGSVLEDVRLHAANLCRFMVSPEGAIIAALIGEAQVDAVLAEAIRSRYICPRREEAAAIIKRGADRGELGGGLDPALGVDVVYGPLFYRLLVTGEPLDEAAVARLVEAAFGGLAASGRSDKPGR
ncbi:TetR/AcrR family transcriptional regulator [Paenibacillus sp. MWE-103]|uniref:TetR/AcrR family transcriptional regulator n=1 Tax=Paenibacillus artemisiicola TaxID=1172618 RepID=A0ABS3WAR1_9BACL|nr:TetR/AcrR family transcriptional regulator [Paenibacillus artemisiicola]MBO7745400.1 TetR/AcrR family transcriptional regulator [Paenibacillus artemisiicola]